MVAPLMSTPIAITASNGWLGMLATAGAGVEARDAGLGTENVGVDVPKLKPPRRSVAVAPACT